jgi:hypothetical protein
VSKKPAKFTPSHEDYSTVRFGLPFGLPDWPTVPERGLNVRERNPTAENPIVNKIAHTPSLPFV